MENKLLGKEKNNPALHVWLCRIQYKDVMREEKKMYSVFCPLWFSCFSVFVLYKVRKLSIRPRHWGMFDFFRTFFRVAMVTLILFLSLCIIPSFSTLLSGEGTHFWRTEFQSLGNECSSVLCTLKRLHKQLFSELNCLCTRHIFKTRELNSY